MSCWRGDDKTLRVLWVYCEIQSKGNKWKIDNPIFMKSKLDCVYTKKNQKENLEELGMKVIFCIDLTFLTNNNFRIKLLIMSAILLKDIYVQRRISLTPFITSMQFPSGRRLIMAFG